MAEPAPWDAPQQPETPPWGSPDEPQEGLLSKGIGMLGSSEGRSQLLTGVQKLPMDILKGTLDWFETPGKAVSEGLTSDEEIGFAANAAIGEITGKVISGQPKTKTTVAPEVAQVAAAFKDSITEPVMTRLDSYARTGDPNGVRLEPPQPEVKPSPIRPVEGSPFGDIPTSIAAKTGIPEVDSVLYSPGTRAVIDNPVIDRQYDVPYMAGGSEPLNDPTVYIDKHVPHEQEVDGIKFDPAMPWSVHENVEQHTMEILTKDGPGPKPDFVTNPITKMDDLPEVSEMKDEGFCYKCAAEKVIQVEARGRSAENLDYVIGSTVGEDGKRIYHAWAQTKDQKWVYDGTYDRWFDRDLYYQATQAQEHLRVSQFSSTEKMDIRNTRAHGGMGIPGPKYMDLPKDVADAPVLPIKKLGMSDEEAYRVAHFEFAEPAEQAWYRNHGIDQEKAEAEQMKWLPRIQHENPENPPPNLYEKPYPHDHVQSAEHEGVTETPPTAEEKERAFDIIRNAPELQPKSAQPMLQQARELGVIGDERQPLLNELPPKEAARTAMAANRPQDRLAGEQPERSEWRKRWERMLDNMATRDDVRQVISGIVDANDEFAAARIGDMRPVQIEQIANVTGLDSTKIDVAGISSKIKSDVELRNFTEAFRTINNKIAAAADELNAKRGFDDAAESGALMQLELQRQLMLDSTVAVKGYAALRAEWGRAGNTLRDFQKSMREAEGVEKIKGIEDLRERARLIAATPDAAKPRVLILSPYKPMPWYYWATQQLLISGPITHAGYSAVNTVQIMLDHVIAPMGQQLLNKVRGAPANFGAPLEAYNAIVRSVPAAFDGATLAFKSGTRVPLRSEWELAKRQLENPEAEAAQVPYTSAMSPDWGIWKRAFNDEQLAKAERVIGVFGRSANAQHTFFKIMGEHAGIASEAYKAAAAEDLAPSMTDKQGNAQFWSRYQYHAANLSDDALTRVIDGGYEGTFMEKLGQQTRVFSELARNTPMKWVFMFTHIPMNIARAGVRYSWMAAATLPPRFGSDIGAALRGEMGMQAQNLALVKATIGTAVGTYFINQALGGQSTGDFPTDQKERNRWHLLGIQPNSVLVDDQWHSLERLGPVMGAVPRLAANYAAIIKQYEGGQDESLMKAAWLMMLGTAKVVSDDVGFQTVKRIVSAFENPKEAGKQMAYQLASYADPFTLGAQAASEMDPYMREADTIMRGIMMRTPFAREELMPKRDPLYGEPVANPGYHAAPFRSAPVNTDPVKAEMDRIKYYPGPPQRTIGHVKLNDEQYDRYEATAGPYVKELLSAVITTDRYKNAAPENQVKELKGWVSYARASARQVMQGADPAMIKQGIDNRTRQILGQ